MRLASLLSKSAIDAAIKKWEFVNPQGLGLEEAGYDLSYLADNFYIIRDTHEFKREPL